MNEKLVRSEIESLEKLIAKIERKSSMSLFGMGIGAIIIIGAMIFYMLNPDIIAGSISLFIIGLLVLVIYIVSFKGYKKRIKQLNVDLDKTKKLLDEPEDKIESLFEDEN